MNTVAIPVLKTELLVFKDGLYLFKVPSLFNPNYDI